MSLQVSGYQEPGTIIGEVVTPAAIAVATTPDLLAIVAQGSRVSRSTNEAVVRGQVLNEALTVAGVTPFTATLTDRSNRRGSDTQVFQTLAGVTTTIPNSAISFLPATVVGIEAGPFDVTT